MTANPPCCDPNKLICPYGSWAEAEIKRLKEKVENRDMLLEMHKDFGQNQKEFIDKLVADNRTMRDRLQYWEGSVSKSSK